MSYENMSLGELSKLTGKGRSTIKFWKDSGVLEEKVKELIDEPFFKTCQAVADGTMKEKIEEFEKKVSPEEGVCHGCRKPVGELICICQDCIKKGVTHNSLGLNAEDCVPEEESKFIPSSPSGGEVRDFNPSIR